MQEPVRVSLVNSVYKYPVGKLCEAKTHREGNYHDQHHTYSLHKFVETTPYAGAMQATSKHHVHAVL